MNNMNYGFKFTEIIIKNDLFIKKGKNKDGSQKIKNEIQFYSLTIIPNSPLCRGQA